MEFFNKWAPWFMQKLGEDFGLSPLDAAAIIGNAGHESGGFKSLQEKKPLIPGSRGGYGIMQWTASRRRAYEAYCKKHKYDPADMETNYRFLFVELKGPEGRVLEKVKSAKTLDEKVEVFMKGFLRPGIEHLPSRKIWASRALEAYKKSVPPVDYPLEPKEKKPLPEVPVDGRTLLEKILDILIKIIRGGK